MATSSCVSKKTLEALQADYDQSARDLSKCGQDLNAQMALIEQCEADKETLRGNVRELQTTVSNNCLLYTSPSPRDRTRSRMPSSA